MRSRCSASISAYIESSPKCAGSVRASAVGSPRPSSARAAYHSASSARPAAAAPVAGDAGRAPGSGRCGRRAACPTQLMPAPHTTATPRGSSTPGAQDREGVVGDLGARRPAARVQGGLAAARSSTGRSALARQAETCAASGRAAGRAEPAPAAARPRRDGGHRDGRVDADQRAAGSRRRGRCRAPARRRRPAPRRSCCCPRRWPGRRRARAPRPRAAVPDGHAHARCSRLCASSRSVSVSA